MDTPLVNGKAYPVLHVAPEAYRFRILSAGNDRTLNLSLYQAIGRCQRPLCDERHRRPHVRKSG